MLTFNVIHDEDLAKVDRILMTAYDNPQSFLPRLARLRCLQPDGWLVAAEDGGSVLGTGGVTVMGKTGYIGLVAVDPPAQRRGIATRVMNRLLEIAALHGCTTVLLDASDAGRPVYERLNFVTDDLVGIWKRDKGAAPPALTATPGISVSTLAAENTRRATSGAALPAELLAFDAAVWGDDRTNVLTSFAGDDPSRVAFARDSAGALLGYAIMQGGTGVIGPWVAMDPDAARTLLSWATGLAAVYPEIAYLPSGNVQGAALLDEAGFVRTRQLAHMRLGMQLPHSQRQWVYSQANLALG